jgi:hypothetical protein
MAAKRNGRRLSMTAQAAALVVLAASACTHEQAPQTAATSIPRPSPDDPTPTGIVYLCEGRKQVHVVYARNRASLTHEGKTWRLEYQQTGTGFRYFDALHEWTGTDAVAVLRQTNVRVPLAFNCRATAKA